MKSPHHIWAPLSKLLAIAVPSLLCASLMSGQNGSFVSFDAPGAGTGSLQGTVASAINLKGVIAGYYFDSSNLQHGFLRQPNGQITTFNPANLFGVLVSAINNSNVVLGSGSLNNGPYDYIGFLRNPNGHYTIFSPPGSIYTQPVGLNDSGQVSGTYYASGDYWHGFLRDPDGTTTIIDDPEASTEPGTGTYAFGINASGQVAGYYDDRNTGSNRAFIRDQFGNFTNFDPLPGGAVGIRQPVINLSGEVAGEYWSGDEISQPFLRDASGNTTDFTVTGSIYTVPFGLNDNGVIVGVWENSVGNEFGFERDTAGNLTIFSFPHPNHATDPASINNNGQITGSWKDLNNVWHGFVK